MRRLIENLESRQLFHSAFAASINFQPLNAPRAPGLLTDYGATYAVRRGGLSYGWSSDMQAQAVDRNLTKLQKNDTFITMQKTVSDNSGDTLVRPTWDIGVENGLYQVYIVAGDPGAANERMAVTAEGEVAVSGITRKAKRYIEGLVTVNVTDGKLTIGTAAWADVNKICYVGIVSTETSNEKTLTVEASQPNADEDGPVNGTFRVTRGGDLNSRVIVPVSMSGTAINGTDYGVFGNRLVFAAGVESIDLQVRPVVDGVNESDETVTLTVGPVSGYTIADASATVTLADASSAATPLNVSWTSRASRPVAASEVISASVGNKLYTFGGFVDNTFKPSRATYIYDVTTNSWTTGANLPVGLTHAGVATDGTDVYMAGGYPGTGTNGNQVFASTKVYKYDTLTNTFSTLTDLPEARASGTLAILGRNMYFISGTKGVTDSGRQDVTTVYRLDLDNQGAGWTTRASLPASRNHAAAVTINGSIYVVGGQTGQDAGLTAFANLYRYNESTNTWTTLASLPSPRSHITDATFVYEDTIVVLAGQSAYEQQLSSNVQYDPVTNQWKTLASLPAARFSGAGHLVGDKFVYTGGYAGGFKNNTYVGTLS